MTIIVYDDVIVPDCVFTPSAGGSRTRQNSRTANQGGFASANIVRDVTMKTYGFATIAMTIEAYKAIIDLFEVTDAGAYGMLLLDPTDSEVIDGQGVLQGYMSSVENGTIGFGNGGPLYGFRVLYAVASHGRTWPATRPISPVVTRNGSPVTVGIAAGNIAINTSGPKYVTFVPDATRTVTGVTVGATTQVTLNTAIGLAIGEKLWLQGLTGADAALLNNQAHTITNITGGGLNVYTLSTNTAGKTITAAGQGHSYPQADDALSWTGSYYTPVQFASDSLDWELALGGDYEDRLIAGPSVSLLEVREA